MPARTRAVLVRYSDEEYGLVAEAGKASGLTPTGYVAEAALAAARGIEAPSVLPLREALLELIAARTQVRRFGVNVNQAVRQLNAVGEAPTWLADAVHATNRAVSELEHAATAVVTATRSRPPRTTRPVAAATAVGNDEPAAR